MGAGFPCGAFPDPVYATAAPGAGRGRGVQRDMTEWWLLWRPLFPLAVRPRGVAAHGMGGHCAACRWEKPGGKPIPSVF